MAIQELHLMYIGIFNPYIQTTFGNGYIIVLLTKEVKTMFIQKWYNVELNPISAELLKDFLRDNGVKFDSSGCYNLVHLEMFIVSQEMYDRINNYLTFLP